MSLIAHEEKFQRQKRNIACAVRKTAVEIQEKCCIDKSRIAIACTAKKRTLDLRLFLLLEEATATFELKTKSLVLNLNVLAVIV